MGQRSIQMCDWQENRRLWRLQVIFLFFVYLFFRKYHVPTYDLANLSNMKYDNIMPVNYENYSQSGYSQYN